MSPSILLKLMAMLAAARGVSVGTVGRKASGSGDFAGRLRAGGDITTGRARRVCQWLSNHWPAGAVWPADIPQPEPEPEPEPGAPATESVKQTAQCQITDPGASVRRPPNRQIADPAATVRALLDRCVHLTMAGDHDAADAVRDKARAIAILLHPVTKQIASAAALCTLIGCRRHAYDNAVRRYAGRPRRMPRNRTETAAIVRLLRGSGDVRFLRSADAVADAAAKESLGRLWGARMSRNPAQEADQPAIVRQAVDGSGHLTVEDESMGRRREACSTLRTCR